MSDATLMKNFSAYRLSSHFGMGMGGYDQRLSHFLTSQDRKQSFFERKLSSHAKLAQSKQRDVNLSYWASMRTKKQLKKFCTGSRYLGEWNALDFSGEGVYRYPHGVIYEGEFNKNGLFHGLGSLTYPNGQKLQGMWKNGRLEEDNTYIFACNEILDENFKYCYTPDRSFHIEIQKDFGPTGQEYLTADQPTKKLREGCYDVGLGFYDPKLHCLLSFPKPAEDISVRASRLITFNEDEEKLQQLTEISKMSSTDIDLPYFRDKDDQFKTTDGSHIIEIPTEKKVRWIENNCRKAWDEPVGYKPVFYEKWMVGRKQEAIFNIASSAKSIVEEIEPPPTKTHKQTNKIRYHENQKFLSFIQKRSSATTLPTGTTKKILSIQKQERKKEERRTIHNRTLP